MVTNNGWMHEEIKIEKVFIIDNFPPRVIFSDGFQKHFSFGIFILFFCLFSFWFLSHCLPLLFVLKVKSFLFETISNELSDLSVCGSFISISFTTPSLSHIWRHNTKRSFTKQTKMNKKTHSHGISIYFYPSVSHLPIPPTHFIQFSSPLFFPNFPLCRLSLFYFYYPQTKMEKNRDFFLVFTFYICAVEELA